jgi:hypothetical protein
MSSWIPDPATPGSSQESVRIVQLIKPPVQDITNSIPPSMVSTMLSSTFIMAEDPHMATGSGTPFVLSQANVWKVITS